MYASDVFAPRRLGAAFTRVIVAAFILALLSTGFVVLPANLSTPALAFAFHSSLVDQDPSPTLLPGATATYSIRFRNTGIAMWQRGGSAQVNLAVNADAATYADLGMPVGWISSNRVATTAEQMVLPGMIGTFSFTVRAPTALGVYRVPLRLVVDGLTWLEDEHVLLVVKSDLGFHSQLVDQALHPILKPGETSAPLTLRFRNTGARTWTKGVTGQQVNLGVVGDDKMNALAVGWPTSDRVAVQNEAIVRPSDIASFTFRVRAPTTLGTYPIRLRLVIDGVAWLEDDGIVSLVTVVSGAGGDALTIPATAAKNASTPNFSFAATADPKNIAAGDTVRITGVLTTPTAGTALVGIEVYSPGGATLALQRWYHNESFAVGEQRSYALTWDVPSAAPIGTYAINVSAYSPGWKTFFGAKPTAATFTVAAPVAASAPPAAQTATPAPSAAASAAPSALPTATSAGQPSSNPTSPPPGTTAPTGTPTATPTATPAPTPTATPVPTPRFSSMALLNSPSVVAGGSMALNAVVTATSSATALIDVEIYPEGSAVPAYQVWFDNQSFGAGQQRSYPVTWQVPANASQVTHVVKIGVYAPGWQTLYDMNNAAGTFMVTAPAPSPSPTPTATASPVPTPVPTVVPSSTTLNDPLFVYAGSWSTSTGAGKYLSDDHFSSVTGATFSITFSGTSLRLYSAVASHHGIGAVSIDGGPESDVDFYAATRQEQALVYATPSLANANHTVVIRVTGRKNAASTGFVVSADRADLNVISLITPTPAPTPAPTVTLPPAPTLTPTPAPVPTPAPGGFTLIPSNRLTTWSPGIPGGVPSRTTVCANVSAATYGNGSSDARAGIQAALDSCPVGQVVQLSAGDFKIASRLEIRKGIVLRGAGPTQTKLKMPIGTTSNLITVGTLWFKFTQPTNLTGNAVKGARTLTVASVPSGLAAGEIVLLDQLTNPGITQWCATCPLGDVSRTWFTRPNRPVGQVMEVQSVSGNTVTFTTPFHIDFLTAYAAQMTRFSNQDNGPAVPAVKYAGVEDLYMSGGGDGNIQLSNAAYSWIKNIESDQQDGASVAIDASFRSIVRDSYVHTTRNPYPGGGGYGISFSFYTADSLVENNIVWNQNKVMVMRASGGGNVIGYNYMEDGRIGNYPGWVETGLNASHMTTPHFELFEGNQSFNFDGDNTWGNSVYITVFRNHLTGKRRSIAPLQLVDTDNVRAIGLMSGHKWYSFVGNVLGTAGQSPTGWVLDATFPWSDNPAGEWRLGYNPENWNAPPDPGVTGTVIREGNFDYATNLVHWGSPAQLLPASLYLSGRPAFFGSNPWPWVDPTGSTKVYTLPARARFDAMPTH